MTENAYHNSVSCARFCVSSLTYITLHHNFSTFWKALRGVPKGQKNKM